MPRSGESFHLLQPVRRGEAKADRSRTCSLSPSTLDRPSHTPARIPLPSPPLQSLTGADSAGISLVLPEPTHDAGAPATPRGHRPLRRTTPCPLARRRRRQHAAAAACARRRSAAADASKATTRLDRRGTSPASLRRRQSIRE